MKNRTGINKGDRVLVRHLTGIVETGTVRWVTPQLEVEDPRYALVDVVFDDGTIFGCSAHTVEVQA